MKHFFLKLFILLLSAFAMTSLLFPKRSSLLLDNFFRFSTPKITPDPSITAPTTSLPSPRRRMLCYCVDRSFRTCLLSLRSSPHKILPPSSPCLLRMPTSCDETLGAEALHLLGSIQRLERG